MEGLVGTALPFLPTPVGTEMGAGPGWVGGFLGALPEGQGEGLCRGGRHHVDCTIKREMYKLTARRSWDEKEGTVQE